MPVTTAHETATADAAIAQQKLNLLDQLFSEMTPLEIRRATGELAFLIHIMELNSEIRLTHTQINVLRIIHEFSDKIDELLN